ncbi:MAG TPA: CHASE domain-containing protein [Candidatus Saccharimonadales bacterium]|nr:CHASE domain-containing protein [Candidatus Saccharimonadales bacterium]
MFFIEKRLKFSKRDITSMHLIPALVVFIAFSSLTVWNWADQKNKLQEKRSETLLASTEEVQTTIEKGLASYVDVVNSGTGLFEASDYVSRDEWRQFVDTFNLQSRYPGIRNLGYTRVIPSGDLQAFIKTARTNEKIKLEVYPKSDNTLLAPIIYAEPKNGLSRQSLGYDMYSEPVFREAMRLAENAGEAVFTEQITKSKKGIFGQLPEIVLFAPVYAKNQAGGQRSKDKVAQGYIYADILSYKLIRHLVDGEKPGFAFRILESKGSSSGSTIYKSPGFDDISAQPDAFSLYRNIGLNNLSWSIQGIAGTGITPPQDTRRPITSLWFGIFFSTFLALFIYILLANRTKALSDKEAKELQFAKDELLALASHQLRTPATGVKQYIGMLREGYGGTLTKEQKTFLNKAYESNERQLNTINDMLFVARTDTDDIQFDFNKTDLLAVVTDIIEEHKDTIRQNGQKLIRKLPSKPVYAEADRHYLRMAIENILNNATKYTRPGGTITVSLNELKKNARLSVEDTGVGVHEKYRHLLFRKFSRVPNELSSSVSGSGIGLYLAKKVSDAHGGTIEFKSIDRKGSRCTITIPLEHNINSV